MFCAKCGASIKEGQKFCMKCGAPVVQASKRKDVSEKADAQKIEPQKNKKDKEVGKTKKKIKTLPVIIIVVAALLVVLVVVVALKLFVWDQAEYDKNTDDRWVSVSENSEKKTETETQEMPATENQEFMSVEPTEKEEEPEEEEDYDYEDYILPQSAVRKLTAEDLEDIKDDAWLLKLARNEIFARHGREFNDEALQEYFDSKDWYSPIYSPEEFDANIKDYVPNMEMQNAKFIQKYEKKLQ